MDPHVKTDPSILYPIDFIKTRRDINEPLNGLSETDEKLKCWICGQDVIEMTSNVISLDIFDDAIAAHEIHGLLCKDEKSHVAALKVGGRWWCIEEMLSSNDTSRNGLMEVRTFGDRLVLYVLNTVVYNQYEKNAEDPTFQPHPVNESGKIMWQSGKAIGFYTIKKKGKLISRFLPEVWELNVLDTIFVRKCFRSQGFAKRMVDDFINAFPSEDIGFSYPLSDPLKAICVQILERRKEDRDRIWECREPGGMHGRINLWRSLKSKKMLETP